MNECKGCARTFRPYGGTSEEYPGMPKHHGKGLCGGCAKKLKRGTLDLGPVPLPGEWVDEALCAQTDPEAFFPDKGGSTRDAKRVCASCDVRNQCLAYALETKQRFGIWGGLSERERRPLLGRAA